ncbi:hypothetical protein [Mycoplasmopsis arginini]|uniref:hypothetical protein n=1 Tax=Mycoplasmopsis arginini TaxID=2094 RepID=UPI00249DA3A8|nr:hypothetical protein [Mycoplasmopsis arginini]MDI3348443.1 hypothetical protein [Mycoplasmopsis arginini]MDI3351232.1 hypothetical protein [Mycoplasmopsis arginini]MDI3352227.1 hypothetical protein [Mycoplasmopsis arginini]
MNKLKLLPLILVPAVPLTVISCQNHSNNQNIIKEKETIFNNKIAKEALSLKKMLRGFNYAYYILHENYNFIRIAIKDLIEEQSLQENKTNLTNYYQSFWNSKASQDLNDFAKLILEFNNLFKATIDALSNLNFYLEQFKFDNKNIINMTNEEFLLKLDQDFKTYIFKENLTLDLNKIKRAPIKNLMTALKSKLNEISESIDQNALIQFKNEYKKAKVFIYDNINHINLDKYINEIIETLKNNNKKDFFSF